MRDRAAIRALVLLTVTSLAMAACSSSHPRAGAQTGPGLGSTLSPSQSAAARHHGAKASGHGGSAGTASGGGSGSGTGGSGSGATSGGGSGGSGSGGGGGAGGGSPIAPPFSGPAPHFAYTPANLYSGAAAYQGITAKQITLCMHAATVLGNAFNERPQDIGVYWTYVNANGGLLGRQVSLTIEDDEYTPQGAQVAAQQCQQLNPFLVIGGIGFDQDPVVRQIAEQNHFLYIYTMADRGNPPYKYSFTGAPTIEQEGTWLGEATLHQHRPAPYGAVYVNDAAWVGGYNTYKAYMDAHGGSSVNNNSYATNSGGDTSEFSAYITELQAAGVKTVLLWMNALAADAFVEQAHNQGYDPAYVTCDVFDLVTQTVGSEVDDQGPNAKYPMLGIWITPAFDPADHNVPWWPEEQQMLQAYAKYDAGHTPDDIDWMAWLGFKQIADLFRICGTNCNRNDIAGIFDSGYQGTTAPLCPVNFAGSPNFGGYEANMMYAHRENGGTVWRQTATCQTSF
ncbi:MAG: ABC transporter substrate-binding protein [Mycobacteriales bacterium]